MIPSEPFTHDALRELCDRARVGPTVVKLAQELKSARQETYRLGAIVRSQVDSLNHWRKAFDATQIEERVREWVNTRIGADHMDRRERAMRLLEEAVELAQSEGIDQDLVLKQVEHVYGRREGEPAQEAGGVAVCLYGWCAATGNSLTELANRELERIEAKPLEQIRGSLARKADEDLVTVVEQGEK